VTTISHRPLHRRVLPEARASLAPGRSCTNFWKGSQYE